MGVRRSERRDTTYSPRAPEEDPSATACEGALRSPGDNAKPLRSARSAAPTRLIVIFLKKFVIGCHWVHTFTWLNLLLEPKRLLQRFGFVFLGDASFCGFSHKGQEKWERVRSYSCLSVFSHKDQERQERWKDMFEGAFLSPPRKKI